MAGFYIRSAKSLDRVLRDECSVKAAAAAHADAGRVLAVLVNSLAYRSALMHALEEAKVIKLEDRVFSLHSPGSKDKGRGKSKDARVKEGDTVSKKGDGSGKGGERVWPSKEALLLVLCHDLLFQSRGIQAAKTWPPKVTLERYKPSLHSSLVKLQIRTGKSRLSDLRSGALYQEITARIPRWIRINPLRSSRGEVLAWLEENKYVRVEGPELGGVREFMESEHVPGLLAFHPKATSGLLGSKVYEENWVVMQDLASCFPAYILNPEGGDEVVDATSAPGNKTSHLSAIMCEKRGKREEGRVYAFERDAIRYKTLVKRLAAVGALQPSDQGGGNVKRGNGNVVPERKDFLTTKPEDFTSVTHMLVDPSCSGSGIVNRLDFLKEDDDSEDPLPSTPDSESSKMTKMQRRLVSLSDFQLVMLRHAFRFPSLQKLVYSTCSIHTQENEEVVIRALDTQEAKQTGWKLAPRAMVIPSWPVRGDKEACGRWGSRGEEVSEAVIRCVPGGTGDGDKPHGEACNGFFVACFVRDPQTVVDKASGKRAREEEIGDEAQNGVIHAEADEEENDIEAKEGAEAEKSAGGANTAANRKKKLQKKRKKQRLQEQQHQPQ